MLNIQPAIVIVGAGAAGIAAATKLITNGFKNVTVLEAENRIGGRLHSVSFGKTVVDLGAQWVHGEQGNIVYEMVKDLDVTSHNNSSDYENLTFFTSNNVNLNKNLTERLYSIAHEVLDDEMSATEHGGSLGAYFREKYYDKVNHEFESENRELLKVAKMIEEWTSKFLLCLDPADSLCQIASRNLFAYKKCEGDQLIHWKNNGYSHFLDVLITKDSNLSKQEFLNNNIVLNKEVNKIIWGQNSDQTDKVKLHCSDGSTYLADHVVLTVSVAVLKQIHATLFEPKLPDFKIRCVENIPLGNCHKIFLKFPEKWWPNDVKDFSFLWTDEDKKNIVKEFPDGPRHSGRSWLQDIFGFYTINNDPNILLGWLVGPMTKEVEGLPDEIVQKASMFLLRKFVGKRYNVIEPTGILRYLATGISFRALTFSFRMSHTTIRLVVYETCDAIWNALHQKHMPFPTTDMFTSIADKFYRKWKFPNCIGAIDGKHIRIMCPANSGSMYFNYKKYFSIVLQAVVDADYKFIAVDVGSYGKQSDGGIFTLSSLFSHLENDTFNIPPPKALPGTTIIVPHVFVGDAAYPLKTYLMRPFSGAVLTPQQENFNYNLSRARRLVECAFGIITSKWRILKTEIEIYPDKVDLIIKCICLLHNIIIDIEGMPDLLQSHNKVNESKNKTQGGRHFNRATNTAYQIRNNFLQYFTQEN